MITQAQVCALICTLSILANQYNFFSNKLLSIRPISTNVERPLQIAPFMQNKPKSQKPKMAINYCTKRTYKDSRPLELLKNKPKQSQNKPKVKIGKIDPNPLFKNNLKDFFPLPPFKNGFI